MGYTYNPDLVRQPVELSLLRAELATAILLLVGAVVASIMVLPKSWLKSDGTRDRSRITTFGLCLAFIIIARVLDITNLAMILRGPNRWTEVHGYYNASGFWIRPVIILFFDKLSPILFFRLAIIEVTRHIGQANVKNTRFEKLGFSTISILLVDNLLFWILSLYNCVQILRRNYRTWFFGPEFQGILSLIYAVPALLLAFALAWRIHSTSSSSPGSFMKTRSSHLRNLTRFLCLGQSLYLAWAVIVFFAWWARFGGEAIGAIMDVVWMIQLLLMAVLAWDDYKMHRSDRTHESDSTPQPADQQE